MNRAQRRQHRRSHRRPDRADLIDAISLNAKSDPAVIAELQGLPEDQMEQCLWISVGELLDHLAGRPFKPFLPDAQPSEMPAAKRLDRLCEGFHAAYSPPVRTGDHRTDLDNELPAAIRTIRGLL